MERIGAEGCYFLSLLAAVERELDIELDIYSVYLESLEEGVIKQDCYINDPAAIFDTYLGKKWLVEHKDADYLPQSGEITILRYERKETTKTWSHFVLADRLGTKVEYDPYGDSRTVAEGKLISKRVLRRIG